MPPSSYCSSMKDTWSKSAFSLQNTEYSILVRQKLGRLSVTNQELVLLGQLFQKLFRSLEGIRDKSVVTCKCD